MVGSSILSVVFELTDLVLPRVCDGALDEREEEDEEEVDEEKEEEEGEEGDEKDDDQSLKK